MASPAPNAANQSPTSAPSGATVAPRPLAIEVRNLVCHYDGREVLKNVDFAVASGEVMVVMGGSGSGKTTLLRCMLGLKRPSSGSVRLLGEDVYACSGATLQALRKKMGVAFQGGALLSSLTLAENVMLPLVEHTRLDRSTMRTMARMKLEAVDLGGYEDLKPAELSGGMVKRAALARAIVLDPPLLFFDEPSAGLDPVVAAEIDELIIRLRDALGMTIVVVTHELASAFRIADRITVLDRGEILQSDRPPAIRESTIPRVQDLIQRRPGRMRSDTDAYLGRLRDGA